MKTSLEAIQERWNTKYGHLSLDDRKALIKKETDGGLQRLIEAGVCPIMSVDEVMNMTRER